MALMAAQGLRPVQLCFATFHHDRGEMLNKYNTLNTPKVKPLNQMQTKIQKQVKLQQSM